MTIEEATTALNAAGIYVKYSTDISHGVQLVLTNGGIVNVYTNGNYNVQGKNQEGVRAALFVRPYRSADVGGIADSSGRLDEAVTGLSDPKHADCLIVDKIRTSADGKRQSAAHYACGPLRDTHEEAAADARVFQRLPAIREVVDAARRDPERLAISCITTLCRELEIDWRIPPDNDEGEVEPTRGRPVP